MTNSEEAYVKWESMTHTGKIKDWIRQYAKLAFTDGYEVGKTHAIKYYNIKTKHKSGVFWHVLGQYKYLTIRFRFKR